jgi:heme-degrading monooxygenase HmoA
MSIAQTPEPPYCSVIFTSFRTIGDNGYAEMAERMVALAAQQEVFLGIKSAREDLGLTVSYWRDLESIRRWHENAEHQLAQQKGYEIWYQSFKTRICKVERDYEFTVQSSEFRVRS